MNDDDRNADGTRKDHVWAMAYQRLLALERKFRDAIYHPQCDAMDSLMKLLAAKRRYLSGERTEFLWEDMEAIK